MSFLQEAESLIWSCSFIKSVFEFVIQMKYIFPFISADLLSVPPGFKNGASFSDTTKKEQGQSMHCETDTLDHRSAMPLRNCSVIALYVPHSLPVVCACDNCTLH